MEDPPTQADGPALADAHFKRLAEVSANIGRMKHSRIKDCYRTLTEFSRTMGPAYVRKLVKHGP